MHRVLLHTFPPMLFLLSCSRDIAPLQECGKGHEIIMFAEATAPTKTFCETTSDVLVKEGFSVAAESSDRSVHFTDRAVWDSTSYCFKTLISSHLRPMSEDISMDFDAVYPPQLQMDGEEMNYDLDWDCDVVAASRRDVQSDENPVALTFNHIMAKMTLRIRGKEDDADYTIEEVSIRTYAKGSYSFASGKWTCSGEKTSGKIDSGQSFFLFPGTVGIRARWSCRRNGIITGTYDRSVDVTIEKGRHSIVNLLLSDDGSSALQMSVSVAPWETDDQEVTFN